MRGKNPTQNPVPRLVCENYSWHLFAFLKLKISCISENNALVGLITRSFFFLNQKQEDLPDIWNQCKSGRATVKSFTGTVLL